MDSSRTKNCELRLDDINFKDWEVSSGLEWLVTNGIGGYASGTLAGADTRRYHGFLVAALAPPLGRMLLVAHLDESVTVEGKATPLSSSQWWDSSVSGRGYEYLESFRLDNGIPVFTYRIGDYLLEKRVWMEQGQNLSWATYSWQKGAPPAILSVRLCLAHRDYHGTQRGSSDWHWRNGSTASGCWFSVGDDVRRTVVQGWPLGHVTTENQWYWSELHAVERERGLDDVEDLWVPCSLEMPLCDGETAALTASVDEPEYPVGDWKNALDREMRRRQDLLQRLNPSLSSEIEKALGIAADAFLVRRPLNGGPLPESPNSVIAGYHWFGDWGRDTMISLPGLALAAGRPEISREILLAYSRYVSDGMLPNRFPDSGQEPEYNTVDATLWYFQAIHRYLQATGDEDLLRTLYPVLQDIISCHQKGTRHGIHAAPDDGLLWAGGPGLQLTWMDAKVGDWVVTPRTGKPVEIQGLWFNALSLMAEWAKRLGEDGGPYAQAAAQADESFNRRFWIAEHGYLYDVIDGPEGDDSSFRPNQLIAASLAYPLLSRDKALAVVSACEQRLLTPCGLRSLDPGDSRFIGVYEGDQNHRDGAYHQGTVWAWLIGPFVDALLYASGDKERARSAVQPLLGLLKEAGVGTISEIFDGNTPHTPRGCIAQAWSVAEVLRVMALLRE